MDPWNVWNQQASNYYQAMPTNQVDWAALAQQWIAIKGNDDVHQQPPPPMEQPQMPRAPPPPVITQGPTTTTEEGGEANMDLDDEDEQRSSFPPAFATNVKNSSGYGQEQRGQKHGGSHHNHHQQQHRHQEQHHHGPRNTSSHRPQQQNNHHRPGSHHPHIPSLMSTVAEMPPPEVPVAIDAAARKTLPRWIREGLEKMEKEKRKKEEEERRAAAREKKLQERREEELRRQKENPGSSKFDEMKSSESEEEEEEEGTLDKVASKMDRSFGGGDTTTTTPKARERRSRFGPKESPSDDKTLEDSPEEQREESPAPAAPLRPRTKEEMLEDRMFVLKRTLTEILLEVTTEEIKAVGTETLSRSRELRAKQKRKESKGKSAKALGSLLSGYASSDSDSGGDVSGKNGRSKSDSDDDDESNSDSELESRIRRKRRDFETVQDDIHAECDNVDRKIEERDKRWKGDGEGGERESEEREAAEKKFQQIRRSRQKSKSLNPNQSKVRRQLPVTTLLCPGATGRPPARVLRRRKGGLRQPKRGTVVGPEARRQTRPTGKRPQSVAIAGGHPRRPRPRRDLRPREIGSRRRSDDRGGRGRATGREGEVVQGQGLVPETGTSLAANRAGRSPRGAARDRRRENRQRRTGGRGQGPGKGGGGGQGRARGKGDNNKRTSLQL